MHSLAVKTARVTKTPSDGKGTFSFSIAAFTVDSDNEIVENYVNVGTAPVEVDLDYGHLALLGSGADPLAQKIGTAAVRRSGNLLLGEARLDLANRVAGMVHERLLLPSTDPAFLGEISVWFSFDPAKTTTDDDGVKMIRDAELLSISVVRVGAQYTTISNVKAVFAGTCAKACAGPSCHFRRAVAPSRAKLVQAATAVPAQAAAQAAADRAERKLALRDLLDELVRLSIVRGDLAAKGGDPRDLDRKLAELAGSIQVLQKRIALDETAEAVEKSSGLRAGSLRAMFGHRSKTTQKHPAPKPETAEAFKARAIREGTGVTYVRHSMPRITPRFAVVNEPAIPANESPPETFRVPQGPVDDGPVRGRRP